MFEWDLHQWRPGNCVQINIDIWVAFCLFSIKYYIVSKSDKGNCQFSMEMGKWPWPILRIIKISMALLKILFQFKSNFHWLEDLLMKFGISSFSQVLSKHGLEPFISLLSAIMFYHYNQSRPMIRWAVWSWST